MADSDGKARGDLFDSPNSGGVKRKDHHAFRHYLQAVNDGAMQLEEVPMPEFFAVIEQLQLKVFKLALHVSKGKTLDERRDRLAQVQDNLREVVVDEAARLFFVRKSQLTT